MSSHYLTWTVGATDYVEVNNAVMTDDSQPIELHSGDVIRFTGKGTGTVTVNGTTYSLGETLNLSNTDIHIAHTPSGNAPEITLVTINYTA